MTCVLAKLALNSINAQDHYFSGLNNPIANKGCYYSGNNEREAVEKNGTFFFFTVAIFRNVCI